VTGCNTLDLVEVDPVDQLTKHLTIDIFQPHRLSLTFDELAVECCGEKWRLRDRERLVDGEGLWCFADDKGDDRIWLSSVQLQLEKIRSLGEGIPAHDRLGFGLSLDFCDAFPDAAWTLSSTTRPDDSSESEANSSESEANSSESEANFSESENNSSESEAIAVRGFSWS
jgi:hypothetical protein